ncbi:hypothetical protein Scep_000043 [Stephania cephalantha]|uniref:Uncharacterized protein n=1 Tax=Stephania cephalantha TaxID=152367 RepID=A0AAP0L6T6_9MAGN
MAVDVRDVAEALLLVYEKPEANGRYICAAYPAPLSVLVDKMKTFYPNLNYPKQISEQGFTRKVSSEKLERLGWKYRALEETIVDSIEDFYEKGLLDHEALLMVYEKPEANGRYICTGYSVPGISEQGFACKLSSEKLQKLGWKYSRALEESIIDSIIEDLYEKGLLDRNAHAKMFRNHMKDKEKGLERKGFVTN